MQWFKGFIFFISILLNSATLYADDYTRLGWPLTLADLYRQLDAKPKNYFILISRLPSIPLDFRTAEGLHDSVNSLNFHNNFHPGHKMIGWKCNLNGEAFDSMIGLSGESDGQHRILLAAGWGLSSLLATFKDGYIQTPDELEDRFKFFVEENQKATAAGQSKKINLISTVIEISESECEKLINEVYEFVDHPNNPVLNFSMILSPNKYEGAGCGSFATHFMERIGSLKAFVPPFRRQFNLPNYLFGTGTSLPANTEIPEVIARSAVKKPISKFKLINSSWTSASSPNISVEITDPELVVFWQKLFFEAYFDRNQMKKQKKSFNKAWKRGFWERMDDWNDTGSNNTSYVSINKEFDVQTKEISSRHSAFIEGMNMTLFTFSTNFPGIILEKN